MANLTYQQSHHFCRRLLKHERPGLYALSLLFDGQRRQAMYALFAWAHFLDHSDRSTPGANHAHIAEARDILARVYDHRRHDFKRLFEPELEKLVLRFEIPKKLLTRTIEGAAMSIFFKQPRDENEYLALAYDRGGVWGEIFSVIFDAHVPLREAILNLATGLWLTKRVVEAKSDLKRGRLYWPATWFDKSESRKISQDATDRATALAREKLEKAEMQKCLIHPWGLRTCARLASKTALRALERSRRTGESRPLFKFSELLRSS